ncbi:MAG TPA: hypothetical protein VGC42_08505 [Kofleriaceae bacterium]
MRSVLVLIVIACAACSDREPGYGPGAGCESDADCGSDVCSHNGACYPASELRTVHALWTINGAAPDATSCGNGLTMVLSFSAEYGYGNSDISFAPVACAQGQFTLDKLPISFDAVRLQGYSHDHYGEVAAAFDATGNAQLDLQLK